MKKNFILWGMFLFTSEFAFAIYPSIHNFLRKESKAGTQTWDIVQHSNNRMYFANNSGLLEYDGCHWNIYPISNFTNVRALYCDEKEDRIYAAAYNELGYYAHNNCGLLQYVSLKDCMERADTDFNEIWNIYKYNETIYFQGDYEIFRLNGKTIDRLNFPNKIECSGIVHGLLVVATSEDGAMVVNGNLSIALPGGNLLKNKKVCAILPFKEKDIFFVTASAGIYRYNGEKVMPYNMDIDWFLCENQSFCAKINGSKLAVGTVRNGVVTKDLETNETIYANVYSGLQNNTVLSLSFDKQGNLWLGLDKGIDYVMICSPVYNLFGSDRLYGTGYCSIVKNNCLYLGTNQGLYKTGFPVQTSPEPFKIQILDHITGQVWCLKEIKNTLFCGTDQGAFIIDDNKAQRIVPNIEGTWKFIQLKSHPSYILGSCYKGFFLLKEEKNRWKFVRMIKGFSDCGSMFEEDREGNIWFCHWMKGVFKLSFNQNLDSFSVKTINADAGLITLKNNVLVKINDEIILSNEGGFFHYNETSSRMEHAEKYEHILGARNHSVRLAEMPSGDIWCVSPSFLAIAYKQKDGEYVVDTVSFSYLRNKMINGFEDFYPVNQSYTLISTEDGFSWLDIGAARTEKKTEMSFFKVSIKNVFLTNEGDSLVGGFQSEKQEFPSFEHSQNSIRFEFAAPEYRDEQAVAYSYFLENYDTDWSAYSNINVKEYTKLPQGVYTFRIKARSLLETEIAETAYTFNILPPWYKSTLFIVFYILISIICLILLFGYVKRKSEAAARKVEIRKEKEMQEQEKLFKEDAKEKEKEIVTLKNQKLQYELRYKSQELANSTMNLIRKNEMLLELNHNIEKIYDEINKSDTSTIIASVGKRLQSIQQEIKQNIERDDYWKKFAENFDLIYENYLKRLKEQYPSLSKSDLKLCAYLKMGLRSKEIAPLLNMSFRSVEMCRYRLRKKITIGRDINLTDFLQNF
jgi:hypothetical protein